MSSGNREQPAWLGPLQDALAEALPRLWGTAPSALLAGRIAAQLEALEQGRLALPLDPEEAEQLRASPLCRAGDGAFVIEDGQISWRRWQARRQEVIAALLERARPAAPPPQGTAAAPSSAVPLPEALDQDQRRAVAAVLRHRLVLVQGGPGTGKTSTVAAMLAAVLAEDPSSRLHLAAPTGKAAARLRAATAGRHPCSTLHRLLESRGDHFGRDRHHPLALDLVVVDEVSMVDLELMAALLAALPAPCRLVLVGDPAQLPPIAPGAVLLDLQQPALREALGAAAITLGTTYRNAGAIAAVAADLRSLLDRGDGAVDPLEALRPRLESLGPADNLRLQRAPVGPLPAGIRRRLERQLAALARLAAGCRPDREGAWRALLDQRERLLVLAPQRRGPWGVETLHRLLLGAAALSEAAWPEGLPVLCTRNLPELGLANGDVGVLVGQPGEPERRVLFGTTEPLWIHPAQLAGAAEPALVLTVHKAQGSEAAEVIVLLADPCPDTRLLYTAITRARRQVLLLAGAGQDASCRPSAARPH